MVSRCNFDFFFKFSIFLRKIIMFAQALMIFPLDTLGIA